MMRVVLSFLVLLPVHFYRLFISPLLGPRCRFQPTCSEYAVEAVRAHGAWAGLWLSLRRLSHCHQIEALGARHGFDPVPVEIYRGAWYAPWKIKAIGELKEEIEQ
jgi:putative membrane protein insertion efficiency factor